MRAILAALLWCACAGAPHPVSPTERSRACDAAVARAIDRAVEDPSPDGRRLGERRRELAPRARAELLRRCTEDRWSDEVVGCLRQAEDRDEVRGCEAQLTEAQRTAALQATRAVADDRDGARPRRPGLTADGLPAECREYQQAIDELVRCDQLPAGARAALAESFRQASATWRSLPAAERAALVDACRAGAAAVRSGLGVCTAP